MQDLHMDIQGFIGIRESKMIDIGEFLCVLVLGIGRDFKGK